MRARTASSDIVARWKVERVPGLIVTAGTEYAPGPVYRGINTDMLTDDELDEIEEWAAANAYSQNNYQLAEPNYGLIHRIVDRFERSGLGRHWSKDYDVSASFAQDQGDNIAIIFIGDWDGQGVDDREFHRGWDGVQRPSNVEHEKEVTLMPGSRVTLVGVDVVMPNGFTSNIPVPTIQVTASRTAANDLRVHLFDSEGHEMWLEPDFDSNPWTYHPKVMDAVRHLADVAQSNGVYWHMDHNEWIPSTITDFKVFDGPNDVTHEIKEFPQLRGRYASRTAAVDYLLQKLLDECETSETSSHDYAILQAFIKFPEEVLDTHPFAWELKKCQKEARESEYPETDNLLVEWLIEINEKGKGHQSRTAYVSDDIYESYYDTDRLVYLVMNVYVWGTDQPLWELVANSPEEAQAFFDSLDEDERRVNVSEVLENGGWDLRGIGRKFSNRTAAEPGGVLPWNPSTNGYYWITKTDGTLEAVTNDGVNRMYLHEYPYGWEWEVFDNLGLVESGNFGTALKGGDALRDRADDLLAEFDTNPLRRTRGPSRGYQDDYTQAPNQLWGRRVALHHETGNDDGVAIVLTFPLEYREHLAMPEGSPAEELHITLGYFGSISEQDPDSEDDLRHACAWTASCLDPFIVRLGGLIRFSGEDQDAFVLNADSPEIDSVRSVLLGWLDASDRRPDDTHGFTPHMTLGYLGHDDPLPFDRWEPLEVPVTAIELWYGTDRHIYPLGIDTVQAGRKTTSQRYAERLRREGRR